MFRRRSEAQGLARLQARESLGRKLALVLLPLVLVPLLLMGTVAYLRARAILREQVETEMTTATRSQLALLDNWMVTRQQQVILASQRPELLEAMDDVMRMASSGQIDEASQQDLRTQLAGLRERAEEPVFSDLLVARAQDGLILSATVPTWEGQTLTSLNSGSICADITQTAPLPDDPLLSPDSLTIVTCQPISSPEVVLVGLNSGFRLAQLISGLQGFAEQVSVYRLGSGQTYLVSEPDVLVALSGSLVAPTVRIGVDHPILSTEKADDPDSLEYTSPGGEGVMGAYQWMPGWNMAIVNELQRDLIYAGLASLAPFTAALLGAAGVFTVLVVILATNRMLRPLGPLSEFAERISRGDWEFRVPGESRDELGLLGQAFNRMADDLSGMYRSLEARVEERTRQVRTASEVARAVISTPNLEDLMRRAVELIRERFGFYHAAIFLLDDSGENAVLRAATGEVGAAMIARGHKLGVGSMSIIGWVTSRNEPRVASDVSRDPIHFKSELLPGTRSEAAVPLQVAGRVLGALDVQSLEPNAFSPEDIDLLQTLADQLSAAIQNARLAQTSALAADRARLISEATARLTGVLEMDKVLATAARTLHRALGQPEIMVRVVSPGGVPPPEAESEEGDARGEA
jgi:HAMP domain-containing protein